jgi:hypothetical protein
MALISDPVSAWTVNHAVQADSCMRVDYIADFVHKDPHPALRAGLSQYRERPIKSVRGSAASPKDGRGRTLFCVRVRVVEIKNSGCRAQAPCFRRWGATDAGGESITVAVAQLLSEQ